ncbi:MAG: peptidylprolyl isomerase [candidate division Zixibacteria bacterium]|nr:peptidylprolyl isomerase [candidate division Zixibacteria bacterium]
MYLNAPRTIDDDIKRSIIDGFANLEKNPEFDNLIIAVLEEGCNDDWFFLRRRAATVLRDKYDIDKFATIGAAQTTIDKYNYDELFGRYPSNPRALITTARGEIVFELFYNIAPKTVNNYIKLVESGYYDSLSFHRVIPNFVVQDGCPLGTGWGGPGYAIKCENNSLTYKTGMVGMALSGKDTGGSQYFITLSPQPHLDGNYTIFGEVESGMEVAQELVRGDIIESVRIVHAEE